MRLTLLHQHIPPHAPPDEQDTLTQARWLAGLLEAQGHRTRLLAVDLDLGALERELKADPPDVVVNLVESLGGSGRLCHLPPAVVERLGLPMTGCSSEALHITAHKPRAKGLLVRGGLPTPPWFSHPGGETSWAGPWLVKPAAEDASMGIGPDSVTADLTQAQALLARQTQQQGGEWFAEAYIDGREFNLSVLEGPQGPQVLPPAEILFTDWPAGRPRIVDYQAKWEPDSHAFHHTPRRFSREDAEAPLGARLEALALSCWDLFGLGGYARVDLRVDAQGHPWVLEINANPCLSEDAGFMAAALEGGFTPAQVMAQLIDTAKRPVR
ncbi:MAG: D-alanine--D-alanine ligase [Deltaproteobacteria bacterium]|nr:D-alanine--D-alanine ligase [Deltaproteobacteria bacterium]